MIIIDGKKFYTLKETFKRQSIPIEKVEAEIQKVILDSILNLKEQGMTLQEIIQAWIRLSEDKSVNLENL